MAYDAIKPSIVREAHLSDSVLGEVAERHGHMKVLLWKILQVYFCLSNMDKLASKVQSLSLTCSHAGMDGAMDW